MAEPAIAVENLVKKYGKTPALQGISFQVYPGEVFGYLGPNGAGKTTTIRILAGLSSPTSGSCRILGQAAFRNPALYRHLGVVFEESNLYERLSGIENLRFFAALHGVPGTRAQELLQAYDLAQAAKRPVRTYSKGMKRRLLICRALLHDPEVLIMDEPTSGLDPTSASVIHAAIDTYRKQGKTIFLSTHDMAEAETLCDRVAFLNQGESPPWINPRP
jgi:ABC-2 type transport system ATP-binding protein